VKGVGGYAKLKFALGKHETWANVGWALDELNIDQWFLVYSLQTNH
jgi:hypothetical protein